MSTGLTDEQKKRLAVSAANVNGEPDCWEEDYLPQIEYWLESIEDAGMKIVEQAGP